MQQQDKTQRVKIITLSVIAGIIILLLGVWLVSAAMRSPHNSQVAEADTTSSTSPEKPATTAPSSTSASSPADQYDSSSNNTTSSVPAASTDSPVRSTPTTSTGASSTQSNSTSSKNIPATGPQDLLITSILIGATAFLAIHNLQLAKRY